MFGGEVKERQQRSGVLGQAGDGGSVFGPVFSLVAGFMMMLFGVVLTLAASLVAIIAGIGLVTTGFFVGHLVASSSVGQLAGVAKGHTSALYLFFYYMGSSIIGSIGGWFWEQGGWPAVAALTGTLALAGALLALVMPKPQVTFA